MQLWSFVRCRLTRVVSRWWRSTAASRPCIRRTMVGWRTIPPTVSRTRRTSSATAGRSVYGRWHGGVQCLF